MLFRDKSTWGYCRCAVDILLIGFDVFGEEHRGTGQLRKWQCREEVMNVIRLGSFRED
jgi:hypothetical protein